MNIERNNVDDIVLLIPPQEGMLYHHLLDPENDPYMEQAYIDLSTDINIDYFNKAWGLVIKKFDALRSVFRWENLSHNVRIVLKRYSGNIKYYKAENEQEARDLPGSIYSKSFALQNVPFSVDLIKLGAARFKMIVSHHHILYDGWSAILILRSFFDYYNKLSNNTTPRDEYFPIRKEYIKWWLNDQREEGEAAFWKEYLSGFDSNTLLLNSVEKKETTDKNIDIFFDDEFKTKLDKFVKEKEISLAAFFYGLWGILLSVYSEADDVLFGTTVSVRPEDVSDIDKYVGLCINTIPFRIDGLIDQSLDLYLKSVNSNIISRNRFIKTNLLDIRKYCDINTNQQLFNSAVVIMNYPMDNILFSEKSELKISSYSFLKTVSYDLVLAVLSHGSLSLTILYNKLFNEGFVKKLEKDVYSLANYFVENPTASLGNVKEVININIDAGTKRSDIESQWHHVGVAIEDLEKEISYYNSLGFDASDNLIDDLLNIELSFVEKEHYLPLELIKAIDAKSPTYNLLKKRGAGPYHFCLVTESVDKLFKLMRERNIQFEMVQDKKLAKYFNREIRFIWINGLGLVEVLDSVEIKKNKSYKDSLISINSLNLLNAFKFLDLLGFRAFKTIEHYKLHSKVMILKEKSGLTVQLVHYFDNEIMAYDFSDYMDSFITGILYDVNSFYPFLKLLNKTGSFSNFISSVERLGALEHLPYSFSGKNPYETFYTKQKSIEPLSIDDLKLPVTIFQRLLLKTNKSADNHSILFNITGGYPSEKMERTVDSIVKKFPYLKMNYENIEYMKEMAPENKIYSFVNLDENGQMSGNDFFIKLKKHKMDLNNEPLIRITYFYSRDNESCLSIIAHNSFLDLISLNVIASEFFKYLNSGGLHQQDTASRNITTRSRLNDLYYAGRIQSGYENFIEKNISHLKYKQFKPVNPENGSTCFAIELKEKAAGLDEEVLQKMILSVYCFFVLKILNIKKFWMGIQLDYSKFNGKFLFDMSPGNMENFVPLFLDMQGLSSFDELLKVISGHFSDYSGYFYYPWENIRRRIDSKIFFQFLYAGNYDNVISKNNVIELTSIDPGIVVENFMLLYYFSNNKINFKFYYNNSKYSDKDITFMREKFIKISETVIDKL